ncbi:hypothetical protein PWT90_02273 [Aphanocladium album]|nr:hypothetical protein PWT90_02273 [Aphanocladium album]
MKTSTLIATSALATTGYAASLWTPASNSTGGDLKFTLEQTHNEKFKGVNPTEALLRVYSRYATFVPDYIKAVIDLQPLLKAKFLALSSANPSAVSAEAVPAPQLDSEYVIPVDLGTPPQTLPLNLDTGSADLWVFSSKTPSGQLKGQTLYYPGNSTTSRELPGEHWKVKYGDGSGAQGSVYIDRAAIGPVGFDKQAIQVAEGVSPTIASDDFFSGIIGMASSSANTVSPTKQLTFLDNIKNSLAYPVFTANLKKGVPGNYNFGYIDRSEFTGDIAFTPINLHSPFWEVQLTGYQLGDDSFNHETVTGIVDTGTSLMMWPQHIVDEYYSKLPGSYFDAKTGTMMYPCKLTPPDFEFGVGDRYRGHIPGHYLNYARHNDEFCYGGLQSSKGLPFSVFGDILLKAQFVVFDRTNLVVGFANKKTVPAPKN